MSTPVDTTFVRRNNGNFPIVDDGDIGGGYHIVADSAERDAIPSNIRKPGMLVRVRADGTPPGTIYELQNDLTSWDIFTGGGGGGGLPSMDGHALQFLRVKQDESDAEWVQLTQDMIGAAFGISSFSGPGTVVEVGAAVTDPAFTASYNRPAAAATLDDGSGALALGSPFTSFAYNGLGTLPARGYQKTGVNQSVTWTLAAHETDGPTRTAGYTTTWEARAYFGIQTPGTINAAFITGLPSNALEPSLARTVAYPAPGGTKKLYYAFPTVFGAPTRFIDVNTGFGIPFSKVGSAIAVTNGFGVVINYDVWASDQLLVGAVTVQFS